MEEVLLSGRTSFKLEVPYKLIESGGSKPKPLIVYLHGYKQNIYYFQKRMEDLLSLEAYHLFIEGPYPVYDESGKRKVEEWGRAWYLYDGEQGQFIRSLELSSEFVQEVIDGLLQHIEVNRLAIIGYSMGGYLAGYFALSRWKHVNDVVVVGGRIKTEVFKPSEGKYDHLNILALHGSKDRSVESKPQKDSVNKLKQWGANVTFREINQSHKLTRMYIKEIERWLRKQGYS